MSRPHRPIPVETDHPPVRQISPGVLLGLPWIRLTDEAASSDSASVALPAHADRAA